MALSLPLWPVADVAALYVDSRGPYPALVRECFDEARDAKTYRGPFPVVAHPPCGPWGLLKRLCRHQDASCGPHAVEAVRAFGGVLEHPFASSLWRACSLPLPREGVDAFGGRTYLVRQVSWGHTCAKPTWLYVVGVPHELVVAGIRTGGRPTRRVTSGPRQAPIPSASRKARTLTPPAFAQWLVALAAGAKKG